MKKKELQNIVSECKEYCEITERTASSITFKVDDVKPRCRRMDTQSFEQIINSYLDDKQIAPELRDVVASDFGDTATVNTGFDVLYKCILQCFSEHRPLVLTPDAVWLVINQAIASHINANAEKFRKKIVQHEGKMQIVVKSSTEILSEETDWNCLLEDFYRQLDTHMLDGMASKMVCNFSTTGNVERTASVITLMDAVKNYFEFVVQYMICGIPKVTLTGSSDDWKRIEEKIKILKDFELGWWYEYLAPVIREFVNAADGKPNRLFWQNIVLKGRPEDFSHEKFGGCIPDRTEVNGWFLVFFPFIEGNKQSYNSHAKDWNMDSEMSRVEFKYQITDGINILSETPMELWAGLVGVHEDKNTFALTPKAGWFVRVSHEADETLKRLKQQEEECGEIELWIDDEVPEILKQLPSIKRLVLRFNVPVQIPTWLDNLQIGDIHIQGGMSLEYEDELRQRFKGITIHNENKEDPWDE